MISDKHPQQSFYFERHHLVRNDSNSSFTFEEPVIGVVFLSAESGVGNFQLINENEQIKLEKVSGMALSFFARGGTKIQLLGFDNLNDSASLISYIPVRLVGQLSSRNSLIREYFSELIAYAGEVRFGPRCYMTPIMQSALDKIIKNDYLGEAKDLLFESQTTELLAHFLSEISNPKETRLSADEISKLYIVREMITASDNKPPSIQELARMIGSSEGSLKKNFKEYFGEPIYQFGLNYRLGKAYELLHQDNITIKEAAWVAGYDSLGSFSNAFNKRYGYRPSKLKYQELSLAS